MSKTESDEKPVVASEPVLKLQHPESTDEGMPLSKLAASVAPQPDNPMSMIAAAVASGADTEKLDKLLGLQERWEANEARKAFERAMSEFAATCPIVHKDKRGHNATYAGLDDVQAAIRPTLGACGLSVRFNAKQEGGTLTVQCKVAHRDGHSETSTFSVPVDPKMAANDSQKVASANSYARRYALCNALNIVCSDDDDDGVAGGAAPAKADPATGDQIGEINDLLERYPKVKPTTDRMLKFFSVGSVADLDTIQADRAIAMLREKLSKHP